MGAACRPSHYKSLGSNRRGRSRAAIGMCARAFCTGARKRSVISPVRGYRVFQRSPEWSRQRHARRQFLSGQSRQKHPGFRFVQSGYTFEV
jgi:hypothetical protein